MTDLESTARMIFDMMQGPVTDGDFLAQQRQWMLALDIAAAINDRSQINDNNATRLLRQSYVTLAFAFNRLHGSSRSRDGELCKDFQEVRAQIENHFKKLGVKL